MSDVFSVDEHHLRHVLELKPPLPTQPSVSAMPSAPVAMASASTTTMPSTPTKTKGGTALLSRTSVKKWDVRKRRGTSSTPFGMLVFIFIFFISFKPFSDLPFL